jgi:hypothetical protein
VSNTIYSISEKLDNFFGIAASNIPNIVFDEFPQDCSPAYGGIPGQENFWLKGKPSWNKGISPSEETRKKISETNIKKNINWCSTGATEAARQYNLGRKQNKEHVKKRTEKRKRMVEVDGVVYDSLKAASEALGVNISAISGRLKRGKSAKYI